MTDHQAMAKKQMIEPPKLLYGPYRSPLAKPGDWLVDERLGLVRVIGWTDARLSWPKLAQRGPASPVVTEELARAIRKESALAVSYWWGVSKDRVQRWRRELDVGRVTPGTSALLSEINRSADAALREVRVAALRTPESRERSAESRVGKPASAALRAAGLKGAMARKAGAKKCKA
jgi:hypothetical protein